MMRSIWIVPFFCFILFGFEAFAQSWETQVASQDLIQALRIKEELDLVVPKSIEQFEQSRSALTPAQYASIVAAFSRVFDPNALLQEISTAVARDLEAADRKAAVAFYRSLVGQKISAAQVASATGGKALYEMYRTQLQTRPPLPHRVVWLNKIDRALGATELSAEIANMSAVATATALDALLPPDERLGEAIIRQQVALLRPQMMAAVHTEMNIWLLFTYRSLVDPELRYFLDFLESESGKKVHGVINQAYLTYMMQVLNDMTTILARTIRSE